jgi:hypothetical protein
MCTGLVGNVDWAEAVPAPASNAATMLAIKKRRTMVSSRFWSYRIEADAFACRVAQTT